MKKTPMTMNGNRQGFPVYFGVCFRKIFVFAGLLLCVILLGAGKSEIAMAQTASDAVKTADSQTDTGVSPWLEELLPLLAFEVSGTTPQEKQKAIAEHIRKRPVSQLAQFYYANGKKPGTTKSNRVTAQLCLEHKFYGQPAYGPYFRGKNEIDWDTNPVADFEWIVQFHRFSGQQSLANMYSKTKDERYAREWVFEIDSWINHMHRLPVPYKHPGWRTLDTAIRMLHWSMVFDDFARSPSLDDKTLVSFLYSMTVHMDRTNSTCQKANDSRKSLGNWDIHQAEALLVAAAAFPELKCSRVYVQQAVEYLVNFQRRVLLSDGVINEFIPSYHSPYPGNFSRLLRFVDGLKLPVAIPDDYRVLLEKSIDAVTIWSHPDATSPVFGDAWLGSPGGNRSWIRPYLDMFDRPDWVWFASDGKKGTHPASRMRELPVAGYYTMRSDWTNQALFIVLKNTWHVTGGKGHNQADNMTFELSAYGQRLMTDSGCYNYSGEPKWRAWFRSPM
ncbi:MAG: heparinase II/III family protein, partial [Thermoguttaceae bacterium]|nr:heparinase II/III family protein [Thermoguttaceae bacterium]